MEFRIKNPSFREYVAEKVKRQELMKRLDISLSKVDPGLVEIDIPFQKMYEQQDGYLHGGLTGALADITSGFAAYTLVAEGERVVTADIRTSYFRPGLGERIFASGKVVKPGKNFHFCESEVYMIREGKKVLIAKSSSTMAIVRNY